MDSREVLHDLIAEKVSKESAKVAFDVELFGTGYMWIAADGEVKHIPYDELHIYNKGNLS